MTMAARNSAVAQTGRRHATCICEHADAAASAVDRGQRRPGRLRLGSRSAWTKRTMTVWTAAVAWALTRLKNQTGVMVQDAAGGRRGHARSISVDGPGEEVQGMDEDESYTLEITPQHAHLHAATDVGAMHGLETLLQLVQADGQRILAARRLHPGSPRFPWRGLMIDVSPPLRARRGDRANARRHGRRQDERLPLAPLRRPGLPHRKQDLSRS